MILTQLGADILLFLANNPEYDTARDMAEIRRLSKSHLSVEIDTLVKRGLLERFCRDGNRKIIHLRLTPAAAPIIEEGRAVQRRYGKILFDGFSDKELEIFNQLLERVSGNITAALTAAKNKKNGAESYV